MLDSTAKNLKRTMTLLKTLWTKIDEVNVAKS